MIISQAISYDSEQLYYLINNLLETNSIIIEDNNCLEIPVQFTESKNSFIKLCKTSPDSNIFIDAPEEFLNCSLLQQEEYLNKVFTPFHIRRKSQSINPIIIISGPSEITSACQGLVTYSASNSYGKGLNYLWMLTFNDTFPLKTIKSTADNISIYPYLHPNSTSLNIVLEINGTTSSLNVSVSNTSQLIINIPTGRIIYISSSSFLIISAIITDMCGSLNNPISWQWQLNNSLIENLSPVASNLILSPYTFIAGTESIISTYVSSGNYSTNDTVQVIAIPSDIVIVLSRLGGIISSNINYYISANGSYDPDTANSSLNYYWSCSDSNGNIFLKAYQPDLNISTDYLDKTNFTILVNVSSSSKYSIRTLFITTNSFVTSQIFVNNSLLPRKNIFLQSNIQHSKSSWIFWEETSGKLLDSFPNTAPILSIPIESLQMGSIYSFSISVFNSFPEDISLSTITIPTPIPPYCSIPTISSKVSGIFLTDLFNLYVQGCIPGEITGTPLQYSLWTKIGLFLKPLSLRTYSQAFNSYLYPNTNTTFIQVCDTFNTCSNLETTVIVSSRILYTNNFTSLYQQQGIGIIMPLCNNSLLEIDLLEIMWNDLLKIYSNTYFTQDIAEIIFTSISSLFLQKEFVNKYTDEAINIIQELINGVDIDYNLMNLCAELSSNLAQLFSLNVSYTNITSGILMSCLSSFTKEFIIGNRFEYLDSKIYVYKETGLINGFLSKNYTIKGRNIIIPTILPISSIEIINFYLIFYFSSGNYSDILDYSFTKSGTYSNLSYKMSSEIAITLTDLIEPFEFTLFTYHNVFNNWTCGYMHWNQWYSDGCTIIDIINNKISFSFNHSSIISLVDILDLHELPPPIYIENYLLNCGKNYAAIYILIVVTFIAIIILPVLAWIDHSEKIEEVGGFQKVPRGNLSREFSEGEGAGEMSGSDSERQNSPNASGDYAISHTRKEKTVSGIHFFLEGHLTFGIFMHQKYFTRVQRLISLYTVIILGLFLEGALLYGFENTSEGKSSLSNDYFTLYQSKYFGYTIISIIVAYFIEICLTLLYNLSGNMRTFGIYFSGLLILIIVLGSIAGIIYFSIKVCDNWSAYWGISFIWGALLEIIILETLTMPIRFCLVKER